MCPKTVCFFCHILYLYFPTIFNKLAIYHVRIGHGSLFHDDIKILVKDIIDGGVNLENTLLNGISWVCSRGDFIINTQPNIYIKILAIEINKMSVQRKLKKEGIANLQYRLSRANFSFIFA